MNSHGRIRRLPQGYLSQAVGRWPTHPTTWCCSCQWSVGERKGCALIERTCVWCRAHFTENILLFINICGGGGHRSSDVCSALGLANQSKENVQISWTGVYLVDARDQTVRRKPFFLFYCYCWVFRANLATSKWDTACGTLKIAVLVERWWYKKYSVAPRFLTAIIRSIYTFFSQFLSGRQKNF